MWRASSRAARQRSTRARALSRQRRANGDRLRVWLAAQVHHAYRGACSSTCPRSWRSSVSGRSLRRAKRSADCGAAPRHRQENSPLRRRHRRSGRQLIGQITIGTALLREAARDAGSDPARDGAAAPDPVASRRARAGSPVKPMTVEAFIPAAADDLDASFHQVRRLPATTPRDVSPPTIAAPDRALFVEWLTGWPGVGSSARIGAPRISSSRSREGVPPFPRRPPVSRRRHRAAAAVVARGGGCRIGPWPRWR